MNNMKCLSQNHLEKEIVALCLNKNCKNNRFCCLICIKNDHNAHLNKLIEVNQTNTFIEQEKNKKIQYPQTCTYGQQQIIQGLEKLMNQIDILQKIIKEKIEKIKQQNLQNYLKQTSNSQGIEYWNQLLEGILQYVEVDNCVINVTKSKEGQLNQQEEIEIKNIKQSEQSLISMIDQIYQTQIKIRKLCFKEDRKHANLSVIDECIVKQTKVCSFPMAYANEGFDPSSQSYAFAINIQNHTNSIFVGVGNDEGIKASSYIFTTYQELGHGQYMIHSYGTQTIHHTDEEFKWKNKGMSFTTGDKIQIKYNHVTKLLEFIKSSEQVNIEILNTVVKMPITDMTKMLYPCVMVYNSGDQVQLVEY